MQNTEIETTIPRIQLLPEHLIDQIKAGEVLESPANMAKELIENALDAGATKITLKIKNNPLEFFSISDNGHGIHPKDLPLVFARHATSKIQNYNDIYQLSSYGFRGEALASLGSVAKVQIKSKTAMNPSYSLLHQYGKSEKIYSQGDSTAQTGTEIIVTDLFAATPARLKFIQNNLTELQKLRKIIHAYIIAYPTITWDIHQDHDFTRYPANDSLLSETNLLSATLSKKELEYKNIKVSLWIDLQPQKKRNTLNQFIFVNKRLINFHVVHAIITKNLNYSPPYALFIDTIQSNLDVNIHPAKTEVKFFDKASVLALVSTLIKSIIPDLNSSPSIGNDNLPIPGQLNQSMGYHIPNSTNPEQEYGHFTAYEHFYLISDRGLITYGLRLDKIIQALLERNINQPVNEGIPLLVSKPFQFTLLEIHQTVLNYWRNFGLAFHILENNNLILTALPEGWLYINYEHLLKFILNNRITNNFKIPKEESKSIISQASLKLLIELLGKNNLEDKFILQTLDKLSIHD